MPEIARLEPVDLRNVWPYEASDFTPWLACNLDRLGEALGMDLELVQTEAPVGSFSLDIQARDANGDRKVVIENQLEQTNHDHLGKVLTYAAGNDADVMVWVVKDFRDEHRQALDWLNQRTSEATEFWGVVVKAVKIGGSAPAPIFDVVSRPNTSIKIRGGRREGGQPSVSEQAYFAFWPRVLDKLRDVHKLTSQHSSTTRSWIAFSSGIPGVGRNVSFSKQGARVELYIDRRDKELNKGLFDFLSLHRSQVDGAMGEDLDWERLDKAKASRIALYFRGRGVSDTEDRLSETANWMVERYVRLKEQVVPIVKKLAEEFDESISSTTDDADSLVDQDAEEYD